MNWPPSEDIAKMKKKVMTKKNKDIAALKRDAKQWVRTGWENRISYETTWLGVPIIQIPEDIVLLQELVFSVKPDVIIECGIAHGGALVLYASLLELLGNGKVIGIDIEIRSHNRKSIENHPMSKRIKLIEGNSIDNKTIELVKKYIKSDSTVLVCLDSDHSKNHVLNELKTYRDFVTPGSYIVVFDTIMPDLIGVEGSKPTWNEDSPMAAIKEFLEVNHDFEIDEDYNKLYVSYNPNGFLRRK